MSAGLYRRAQEVSMPIEVPDTRAFVDPPRRRRTTAKAAPSQPSADEVRPEAELVAAAVKGPARKTRETPEAFDAAEAVVPVAVVPVAEVPVAELPVAEIPVESAFRKPVRRRKPAPSVDDVAAAEVAPEPSAVVSGGAEVGPAVEAATVVDVAPVVEAARVADSAGAFSRPVRRRPKEVASEAAAAPPALAEKPAAHKIASPVGGALPVPADPASPPTPALVTPEPQERLQARERLQAPAPEAPVPAEAVAPPAPVARTGPVRVPHERAPAPPQDEPPEFTDTVVVRLAGTRYAVAMDVVAEVGRPPHVTRVPGVPAWIAGVANWRGRIMPVLDLRVLLGCPAVDLGATGRIMVLTRDGVTLAFLAERVEGVVSLELDRLEPVLLTLPRSTAAVLSGQLADPAGPIAVLDLDMLFALRSQLPRVRRAG